MFVFVKMASAGDELSVDTVRDFMLLRGGKVTNHDLVKHFKNALTNPETRGRLYYFLLNTVIVGSSDIT